MPNAVGGTIQIAAVIVSVLVYAVNKETLAPVYPAPIGLVAKMTSSPQLTQAKIHPQIFSNNNLVPLNKQPKMGVIHDTTYTFTPHCRTHAHLQA